MRPLAVVLALLAGAAQAQATLSSYEQAQAIERSGDMPAAVKGYVRAARSGDAKAARRLSEIYQKGAEGVPRDDAESRKWDNAARTLGERMIGDFPNPKPR